MSLRKLSRTRYSRVGKGNFTPNLSHLCAKALWCAGTEPYVNLSIHMLTPSPSPSASAE